MPSGAKRRKAAAAAKKKKVQETPTLSGSYSFNGGDGFKGQESDGGEVTSPGGQSFDEEVVNREKSSLVTQVNSEKVDVVKVDEDEDGGKVEVTRELEMDKVEGGVGDRRVEVGRNSDGSSSSSSSSDDEEVHVEKTEVVPDLANVEEVFEVVENADDPQLPAIILEEVEYADDSKVSSFVLEEIVENGNDFQVPSIVLEEIMENADDSQVPAIVLEEIVENAADPQEPAIVLEEVENSIDSQEPAIVLEEIVDNAADSQEPAIVLEKVVENSVDSQEPAIVLEEIVENAVDSQEPAIVLEEVVENADYSQEPANVLEEVVENANYSQVPAIVLEEVVETANNSQVPNIVVEEVVCVSEASLAEGLYEDLDKPVDPVLNSELKATEDDAVHANLPTVVSHGEASNYAGLYNLTDAEDNVLPPSDSPFPALRNGVGYQLKDPEIQDSPENQTPVLSTPLPVQRTSWKGCCGLFEVFTGSR